MHLIRFRLARAGSPAVELLAVVAGCPVATVAAWQRECDHRTRLAGVPRPLVAGASHHPVTAREVARLRAAGITVLEFAEPEVLDLEVAHDCVHDHHPGADGTPDAGPAKAEAEAVRDPAGEDGPEGPDPDERDGG